jgi:hypothetical protein
MPTSKTKKKQTKNKPANKAKKDTKRKDRDYFKQLSWSNLTHVKQKVMDKVKPEKSLLIRMELMTGNHVEFMISLFEDRFVYQGRTYIIDETCKYYVASSKCYALDYHQDYSLPVKRHINANKIKDMIRKGGLVEVEEATNPKLLSTFQKSTVMEMMMKAQSQEDFYKQMKLIGILITFIVAAHFLLYLNETGALSNLNIPFLS